MAPTLKIGTFRFTHSLTHYHSPLIQLHQQVNSIINYSQMPCHHPIYIAIYLISLLESHPLILLSIVTIA